MPAPAALPDAKPDLIDGAQRSQNRELMDKNRIEGRHGAHATPTGRHFGLGDGLLTRSSYPPNIIVLHPRVTVPLVECLCAHSVLR